MRAVLVLTFLLEVLVRTILLEPLCGRVVLSPVRSPPAVSPNADSGMAPKPLTWMVSCRCSVPVQFLLVVDLLSLLQVFLGILMVILLEPLRGRCAVLA